MATLREIIYDVKEMFSVYSDDALLSEEHIAFMIKTKRNTYLKNYISNLKKEIPLEAVQLICVTLEDDPTCEDDFKFLRGTEKLPSTLESTGRSNIVNVYLNSRVAKWINIIDYVRLPYLRSGRYNNNQIYVTIDPDSYPIVYSPSGNHELIENIKFGIIAEDPEEVYNLLCDKDDTCDFYDTHFPIESSMIDPIKKEILNELILKYRIPVDVVNNAEDDTVNKNALDARTTRPRTKGN